ncbi:MAG: c-type cytochrome [Chakrabartia sp.]
MSDQFNTIAGWTLAAGIVALGATIVTGQIFKHHPVESGGFAVAGAESGAEGGAAAEPPIAALLQTADAAKGAEVFKKCASCHTINQGGANGIGPNLWGTLGEEIGKGKAGFAFSPALSGHGGKWDFEAMNQWLKSPKKFADGTKMSFAGLSKPEDRANVIAYLNAQGSNLPLPAAPAAAPAEAAAGNAAAPAEGNAAAPAAANSAAPAAK